MSGSPARANICPSWPQSRHMHHHKSVSDQMSSKDGRYSSTRVVCRRQEARKRWKSGFEQASEGRASKKAHVGLRIGANALKNQR